MVSNKKYVLLNSESVPGVKAGGLRRLGGLRLRGLKGLTCRRVDRKCDRHTHTGKFIFYYLYSVHA